MFSPSEKMVLTILGRKKMTISQIADETGFIYDAGNKVAGIVRRINRKCLFYDLDWKIEGKGSGRAGKTVWKKNILKPQIYKGTK